MPGATKSVVINAPMEKVFDVVTQYERYPEFLSEVKRTKVTRQEGGADVQYEVNVVKNIKYTLRMKEERPSKISWSFVEGELMKDNKGTWVFEPAGEGKTKATYSIEMALGPLVPKAIVNALVETSLPKMLEAFKQRAEG